MNSDFFIGISGSRVGDSRRDEILKEETAQAFEEIFARHLVGEMTKDSFKMSDNSSGMGSSNHLYREFITDALAGELAAKRTLGMADLVSRYWSQEPGNIAGRPDALGAWSSEGSGAAELAEDAETERSSAFGIETEDGKKVPDRQSGGAKGGIQPSLQKQTGSQ